MKLIITYLTILTILALTIPAFGQDKNSYDNPRDPEMTCNQIATNKPLTKIIIAGIKLKGENTKIIKVISDSITSKMIAAGAKICPDSNYYYLEGEFKVSPPSLYPYNRCCYQTKIKLQANSSFCTIYDLAYFSLDASLFISDDPEITGEQINLLAEQIVYDFIIHIKERDLEYKKDLDRINKKKSLNR
jgi:hypothetical protein